MKRRDFGRRAGWLLAALAASEAGWVQLGEHYNRALAQNTPRKLALLIGINQYSKNQSLAGCVTDVELQRELLIHRFGFNPSDILTLSDRQATRQQIEAAFLHHLTEQVRPGDVVVFHFSGYGRRIQLESQAAAQNSLVPVDGMVSTSGTPAVNDLLEETLSLLLRSLATDRITTVLDTSFVCSDESHLQGNLRIRSRPELAQGQISAEALDFQQQLRDRLKTPGDPPVRTPVRSREGLLARDWLPYSKLRTPNSELETTMPGIVLSAAGSRQVATEGQWGGFSAGLFTYALTQYLWESAPATIQVSVNRVAEAVGQLGGKQQPTASGQKSQENALLAYHLLPESMLGADGVITAVENDGKTAQLWLAGIPLPVLEYYGVNSRLILEAGEGLEANHSPLPTPHSPLPLIPRGGPEFPTPHSPLPITPYPQRGPRVPHSPLSPEGAPSSPLPQLQLRSRSGLIATAQVLADTADLKVGQLVRETVRVLPRNIKLIVALDTSLERIERVDATSAFATISDVSTAIAGEQSADYLFGRVQEANTQGSVAAANMSSSRYGLFSPSQELVPGTAGEAGEAVKVAVQRLVPKLQTLLAAKLWRLTANEGSSQLRVRVMLEVLSARGQMLMERETQRSPVNTKSAEQALTLGGSLSTIAIGSRIQYRVHNYSDRPVYALLLGLDSSKNAIALYPVEMARPNEGADSSSRTKGLVIAPGETAFIPQTAINFDWVIYGPVGLAENQLIFSCAQFSQTLAALEVAMHLREEQQHIGPLMNPLDVSRAVLQDLHQASAVTETNGSFADTYALDVNAWASFNFTYRVVKVEGESARGVERERG